ncbi:hypothetical protein [Streptomyces sp. NPDC050504]|uniref:hypothetical protein n=1 Tax=Streptomyces sp. NPDC050504 TaxID=3365618 RepID=UPI003798B984
MPIDPFAALNAMLRAEAARLDETTRARPQTPETDRPARSERPSKETAPENGAARTRPTH